MANHSGGRNRQSQSGVSRRPGTPSFREPEVRRWPHPVDSSGHTPLSGRYSCSSGQMDTALYYIHCALSYQNQLLADIKALLEQMAADTATGSEEK